MYQFNRLQTSFVYNIFVLVHFEELQQIRGPNRICHFKEETNVPCLHHSPLI